MKRGIFFFVYTYLLNPFFYSAGVDLPKSGSISLFHNLKFGDGDGPNLCRVKKVC